MQKNREYLKVSSYEAEKGSVKKIIYLYSGRENATSLIPWMKEAYKAEVIALILDIGQFTQDLEDIKKKALKAGAKKALVIDVKEEFVQDYIAKAIKANANYQGEYHLSTALSRPILARWAVKVAAEEGADAIAHGATGKDNDQVRIEGTALALNPDIKIIAPLRESMQEKSDSSGAYNHDENIWGITTEGGNIDDPKQTPNLEEILKICTLPEKATNTPETIVLEFVKGVPISLNSKQMGLLELIESLNKIGAKHGVGITQSIEDMIQGLKTRGVYEAPAAEIIIAAHERLEKYVSTKQENEFKNTVDEKWAYLCYGGFWLEPLMDNLNAYIEKSNQKVSGKVTLKLYKGSVEIVALETPNTIFEEKLATFMTSTAFNQNASAGFIELYTMQMRLALRSEKTVLLSLGKRSDKVKLMSFVKKLSVAGYKLYATYKTHKYLKKHGVVSIEVNKISTPHLKPNLADLLNSNRFDLIINIPTGKHTVGDKEKTDGQIIREKAVANNIPLITSINVAEETIDKLYKGKI